MLRLRRDVLDQLLAAALDAYPLECCGLLAGPVDRSGRGDEAVWFAPCRNDADSARVYRVHPLDHLRAEEEAERRGLEIIGVVHSHTHSEPYPSPTDIAAVVSPTWHYVIVGLKRDAPEVRSYHIADGGTTCEDIVVE